MNLEHKLEKVLDSHLEKLEHQPPKNLVIPFGVKLVFRSEKNRHTCKNYTEPLPGDWVSFVNGRTGELVTEKISENRD